MLNKRLQILMDKKEYLKLKRMGEKEHKSVGEILREAAKLYGEHIASRSERKKIMDKFLYKLELADFNLQEMDLIEKKKKIISNLNLNNHEKKRLLASHSKLIKNLINSVVSKVMLILHFFYGNLLF